jgi:L-fuculose-phosphate aldolase
VTFDVDLEGAYYKLEIVDAYARILLLAKQIGSIRPLDGAEMKELLELKQRFGLDEPRLKDGGKGFACSSDFITRVGGDVATKGRMATDTGTAPVPASHSCQCRTDAPTPMERAIASMAPDDLNEDDVETLVQTITDQIMATVG